jgi:hypothetical protein
MGEEALRRGLLAQHLDDLVAVINPPRAAKLNKRLGE